MPFFKEIPSFFCAALAAPQPLDFAFPPGNGGVLKSRKREGFRKEGDGGEGKKRGRKDAQKQLGLRELGSYILRHTPEPQ